MLANFMIALDLMWKGMFGIFTVIILITLLVIVMQKVDAALTKKDSSN